MNIEIFWKIISMLKVLEKQGTGESIRYGSKDALMKFESNDIILFKIIYDKYYNILCEKYNLTEKEKENIDNKGTLDFIIAQGYKMYKYYYESKTESIEQIQNYMKIVYGKNVYDGEDLNNNNDWHGFTDIDFLINEAFIEKTGKNENDISQQALMQISMFSDEINEIYREIEENLK